MTDGQTGRLSKRRGNMGSALWSAACDPTFCTSSRFLCRSPLPLLRFDSNIVERSRITPAGLTLNANLISRAEGNARNRAARGVVSVWPQRGQRCVRSPVIHWLLIHKQCELRHPRAQIEVLHGDVIPARLTLKSKAGAARLLRRGTCDRFTALGILPRSHIDYLI